MKTVLSLLVLIVAGGTAVADCKVKNVKSGGRETPQTNLVRKGTKGMGYAFGHDGGDAYLRVLYARQFSKRLRIDETTPLTVTLEDGEELAFVPISETKSKHQGSIVMGGKLVRLRYAVSADELRALAGRTLRSVSISFRVKEREPEADVHEIKETKGATFGAAAACLLAEMESAVTP